MPKPKVNNNTKPEPKVNNKNDSKDGNKKSSTAKLSEPVGALENHIVIGI